MNSLYGQPKRTEIWEIDNFTLLTLKKSLLAAEHHQFSHKNMTNIPMIFSEKAKIQLR